MGIIDSFLTLISFKYNFDIICFQILHYQFDSIYKIYFFFVLTNIYSLTYYFTMGNFCDCFIIILILA